MPGFATVPYGGSRATRLSVPLWRPKLAQRHCGHSAVTTNKEPPAGEANGIMNISRPAHYPAQRITHIWRLAWWPRLVWSGLRQCAWAQLASQRDTEGTRLADRLLLCSICATSAAAAAAAAAVPDRWIDG